MISEMISSVGCQFLHSLSFILFCSFLTFFTEILSLFYKVTLLPTGLEQTMSTVTKHVTDSSMQVVVCNWQGNEGDDM